MVKTNIKNICTINTNLQIAKDKVSKNYINRYIYVFFKNYLCYGIIYGI